MLLMDVNVLVYAFREDVKDHKAYKSWLESVINGDQAFGVSELVLSGFLRVATHPKIFEQPAGLETALQFSEQIKTSANALVLTPGDKHWDLFVRNLKAINAIGNDIPDAYHAALAMEWDCDWITTDKGFKRFKGLRTRHPLQ